MHRRTAMGSRQLAVLGACLIAVCSSTSCLGPSHATAQLGKWNQTIGGKWTNEVVFVLALPAYVLFGFADKTFFNSYYWWTGEHLIPAPSGPAPSQAANAGGIDR